MKNRHYTTGLPSWTAICTRLGIRRTEPPFVHCTVYRRYDEHLTQCVYSDDGRRFSAVAALRIGAEGPEVISRPLKSCGWQDVAGKLAKHSRVARYVSDDVIAWIEDVRPPLVPEIVSIHGPDAQLTRLLRDALGLGGIDLAQAVDRAKLMRVTAEQYFALSHCAARYPRVTIRSEIQSARD